MVAYWAGSVLAQAVRAPVLVLRVAPRATLLATPIGLRGVVLTTACAHTYTLAHPYSRTYIHTDTHYSCTHTSIHAHTHRPCNPLTNACTRTNACT